MPTSLSSLRVVTSVAMLATSTAVASPAAADTFEPPFTLPPSVVDVIQPGGFDPQRPFPPPDLPPLNENAMPASCTGEATARWTKRFGPRDQTFGDSRFGGGFSAGLTVNAVGSSQADQDRINAEGVVRATAKLFGTERRIADLRATASLQGTTATASAVVRVMGRDVYNQRANQTFEASERWDQTFFSASQVYPVLGIPITVRVTAGGSLGFTTSARYRTGVLRLNARPYVAAHATGSVSVDAVLAEVGVRGRLTLVEAALPASTQLAVRSRYATHTTNVDFELASLDGSLELFGRIGFREPLFGNVIWEEVREPIFSWSGVRESRRVAEEYGCIPLI